MEELENWYNQISSFARLKFADAELLYQKAINTSDETQKKAYMDKLILGTLYVVYNYIKRNGLELFTSSSYDMNDIISSFNEVWIKKLYNGDLLKVDCYASLFNSTYFNEVCNNLCSDKIQVNEQFHISADFFAELFALYVKLKDKLSHVNFQNIIKEKYYNTGKLPFYTYEFVIKIIPLFEIIYNNLNFDKQEGINLSKTKISNYLSLIINMGLIESLTNEFSDNIDMEDTVLKSVVQKQFIKDVNELFSSERVKQIIHERFGLDDDYPLYFEDVAKIHGITRERVRQIENKALRTMRKSSSIHKYEEGF